MRKIHSPGIRTITSKHNNNQFHFILSTAYAGIDIGGTSIKYGIVTADGEIKAANLPRLSPIPHPVKDAMIDQLQSIVCRLTTESDSIGVGFPSVVNPKDGCVSPAESSGWGIVPLVELFAIGRHVRRVAVDNDANVAAFCRKPRLPEKMTRIFSISPRHGRWWRNYR